MEYKQTMNKSAIVKLLVVSFLSYLQLGCGSEKQKLPHVEKITLTVNAFASAGGAISPASTTVTKGDTTTFTVTPNGGYTIDNVSGCGGSLSGTTYTTGAINENCTVTANFKINSYSITTTVGSGGQVSPSSIMVEHGKTASFSITPDLGFAIESVTGCAGSLEGKQYNTAFITTECQVKANFKEINSDLVFYQKQILFSDKQTFTLFSAIPRNIEHVAEDIQFSVATHLQVLLLQSGIDYIDTEMLLRTSFSLFSHNALALVPSSHDNDINNKAFLLSEYFGVSLPDLIMLIKNELLKPQKDLYYTSNLVAQQVFDIKNKTITVFNNAPEKVTIDISKIQPINLNYSISLFSPVSELVKLSENTYELTLNKAGVHDIYLNVKNVSSDEIEGSFKSSVLAKAELAVIPLQLGEQFSITSGLLVKSSDFFEHGASWKPVIVNSVRKDELLSISLNDLNGPVTFTYKYSPAEVSNPLELLFVVEDEFDSWLINPSNIDPINGNVTFTYKPQASSVTASQLSIEKSLTANVKNNRVMLHIRQVKGAPTGKDIDALLEGRRSYLEQAVNAGFGIVTTFNPDITTKEQALEHLVAGLYSNNYSVKALSRAKLTKLLQQKDKSGQFAIYEQFIGAINMATAVEVLEKNIWGYTHINLWMKQCYPKPTDVLELSMCHAYRKAAFNEGPELMNEGLSLYLGASELSSQQSSQVQILKVLAALSSSVAINGRPNGYLAHTILVGDAGIAAFNNNPWVSTAYTLSTGFTELLLKAGKTTTIGASVVAGLALDNIATYVEEGVQDNNVVANTPLIFALKDNQSKLLENARVWAREASPWTRDSFRSSFLTGPFRSLQNAVQQPIETGTGWWKSWSSQFGSYLDPGRRLEPLLLFGASASEVPDWRIEKDISDRTRYEALYFLGAAFGDKQKIEQLKQQAEIGMALTVTKTLLDSVSTSRDEVTVLGSMNQLGQRPLLIKSEYGNTNRYLCTVFAENSIDRYANCRAMFAPNSGSKFDGVKTHENASVSKKYIGDFANVLGAAELDKVLYLQLQPDAYIALQQGRLVFRDLKLQLKGHEIILGQKDVTLGGAIEPVNFTSGQIKAQQFTYDDKQDHYVLKLSSLFPQLVHHKLDNRLLGFSLKALFEHAGKSKVIEGMVAYSTVLDDSYLLNTKLYTETIKGVLERKVGHGANETIQDVILRLSPSNFITKTGPQGDFELPDLQEGSYTLFVDANEGEVVFAPYKTDKIKIVTRFKRDDATSSSLGKLNDTGIDWCANANTNHLACPVAGFAGQDGEHGRDALAREGKLQKVGGGAAGFDFTKLDANGNDLPASASAWSCVRDNHTGLIWEVKTNDGGLRDMNHTYSWYNPDSNTNGGSAGTQNGGQCSGSDCDTHAFVQAVNSQGLCGANDWRMPSRKELLGIIHNDRINPAIDVKFFPNTPSSVYWSATPFAGSIISVWVVYLDVGYALYDAKGYTSRFMIRLVRSEK